jgi:hypothetical protein
MVAHLTQAPATDALHDLAARFAALGVMRESRSE